MCERGAWQFWWQQPLRRPLQGAAACSSTIMCPGAAIHASMLPVIHEHARSMQHAIDVRGILTRGGPIFLADESIPLSRERNPVVGTGVVSAGSGSDFSGVSGDILRGCSCMPQLLAATAVAR
eukprot:349668-Chlamydomonas_euryale.AAC.6